MTAESENIETAKRYLREIEDGAGFDVISSFFTTDMVQHEYPNQFMPSRRRARTRTIARSGRTWRRVVASQRYEVRNIVASGDWVALEVTWSAVLKVPVGSIPEGGEMRANFGVFLQFRDGKIARQNNYDCFDPF